MKHPEQWKPSKFRQSVTGLRALNVFPGSILAANLAAKELEGIIAEHLQGELLDLGCGEVPFFEVYRPFIKDNICVDWKDSHHVDHVVDVNLGLPFSDHAFDSILCSDVLEHCRKPDLVFREIARVLKPRGKLVLSVPFLYWIHEEPTDYFRYTEFQLRSFCIENGLEVLLLKATGGSPAILLDIIGKHLGSSLLLSELFWRLAQLVLWLPPVQWLTNRTRFRFPLTYFLVAQKLTLSATHSAGDGAESAS